MLRESDCILITGASGQLGAYCLRELAGRARIVAWSGRRRGEIFEVGLTPVDLANPDEVKRAFDEARPSAVLHCAALARMSECAEDPARAARINTEGTRLLAELAHRSGARLVHVSTDLVFGGEKAPYREPDPPEPMSIYGRTKAQAEAAALSAPRGIVARLSLLFGPSLNETPGFFDQQIAALKEGRPTTLFSDEWRTPLSLLAAARALVSLLGSDVTGILHLGGPERLSRVEMGRKLARHLGLSDRAIVSSLRPAQGERRPRDVSLDSSRFRALFPEVPWPSFDEALGELFPAIPAQNRLK